MSEANFLVMNNVILISLNFPGEGGGVPPLDLCMRGNMCTSSKFQFHMHTVNVKSFYFYISEGRYSTHTVEVLEINNIFKFLFYRFGCWSVPSRHCCIHQVSIGLIMT